MSHVHIRGYVTITIAVLSLLPPATIRAQASAPAITGTVVDSAGHPLPSVSVTLSPLARVTTTDGDGHFAFHGLRPGTYTVQAALIGYAPGRSQVDVPPSGVSHVDLRLHTTALELSGLSVTASPTASDVLSEAQATTEVSGKALQRALAPTVAQTLASQPGISMRYAGPAAAVPMIRGFTGERILVLQDGDRTADLSAASSDHALTLDPLEASRIEVVRGPASLLYGNNALGGVVNIITNATPTEIPGHVDGYIATQGETVASGGAISGAVTVPVSSTLALTARGNGRHMGDVKVGGGDTQENTYSRSEEGSAGFGYVDGAVSLGGTLADYHFNYGLPPEPDGGEVVHLVGTRTDAQMKFARPLGPSGLTDVRVNGTAQWYRHSEVAEDGTVGTTFDLHTQTLEARSNTSFGRVTGQVGVQGLFYQYRASGDEALTPPANSTGVGVFFFQETALGDGDGAGAPHLQIGGRFDHYDTRSKNGGARFGPARSSSFGSVSASVGVSVPLAAGTSLGLSVARAFRAPTVEELFSNAVHAAVGAYQVGTPNLTAETNMGVDAVLRVRRSRVTGEISGYYNRVNNYIAPIVVGDTLVVAETLPLAVFQQADARVAGLEGKLEVEVVPGLVVGAMGDRLRGDFMEGGPLPYMPASRVGGSIRWDGGTFDVGADVRHSFAQDHVSDSEATTGPYTLMDLSTGVNLVARGHVQTITVRLDNVLDQKYAEATSRIKEFALNPGRNLTLVYKMLF
jgi:iron complex outermembrane receptor protein